MDKHSVSAITGAGLGTKFFILLIILLLVCSCAPGGKAEEELRGEIKEVKKEVKTMQEKVDKLEASQQVMLTLMKQPAPPPAPAAVPPQPTPQLQAPALPPALTVSQLLAGKDQYLGARVTVKGEVGPILVHHKSLLLKSPQGMVEVLFGKLPDPKQVNRLTSTPINQALTVTGVVGLPPGPAGAAKLQITAEAVDF
jgi:hypothetical protein